MRENWKKKMILLAGLLAALVLLLLFRGRGSAFDEKTYSERFVPKSEVCMELAFSLYGEDEWAEFFADYGEEYLTGEMAKLAAQKLGVADYIDVSGLSAGAVSREDWANLYAQFLDYLDDENEVSRETALILAKEETTGGGGTDAAVLLTTNAGDFTARLPADYFAEWQAYDLFFFRGECVGIAGISDGGAEIENAYLESCGDGTLAFLFGGGAYEIAVSEYAQTVAQGVCDLVFTGGELTAIRTKQDSIEGKLLSCDENVIEIEGYGRIGHSGKLPVYREDGDGGVSEASLSDVVLGNMDAVYVTGEGEVCAVLLRYPAVIENIRVLLLADDGTKFRAEAYLKSDADAVLTVGDMSRDVAAGEVVRAGEWLGDGQSTLVFAPKQESGKIYLCDEAGEALSNGYAGSMEARRYDEGCALVNSVPFERYLYAVVPSEMPTSYGAEALKAQAVCARSYAYIQLMRADLAAYGAHIDDGTSYQVYNKVAENEASIAAVNATSGLVITYQGEVAEAYYFSTSAGYTDTAEVWNVSDLSRYGYLKRVCLNETEYGGDLSSEEGFAAYLASGQTGYDGDVKFYRWTAEADFSGKEEEILQILENRRSISASNVLYYSSDGVTETASAEGFGKITGLSVEERSASGSILTLKIAFENGAARVKTEYNVRKILGAGTVRVTYADGSVSENVSLLPCASCTVEPKEDGTYVFSGGGYGHLLGMSQNGANGLAKAGYGYADILNFFYEGIAIENLADF